MIIAPGFRFNPSHSQIITLLARKIRGEIIEGDWIQESSEYPLNPYDLNWDRVPGLNNYERYYYAKRTALASEHKQNKKNASRGLKSGQGFWRMSYNRQVHNDQNQVVGDVAHLNFFLTNNTRQSTPFLMHEFTLTGDNFQEWVVCRIKNTRIEKNKPDDNLSIQPQPQPQPLQPQPQEGGQQHHEHPPLPQLAVGPPESTSIQYHDDHNNDPSLVAPDQHQNRIVRKDLRIPLRQPMQIPERFFKYDNPMSFSPRRLFPDQTNVISMAAEPLPVPDQTSDDMEMSEIIQAELAAFTTNYF